MLIIGFWTRFVALVLLVLLAIGGYCWLPQESQIHFQIQSLYGVLFFYLFLMGGGQWAASRRRGQRAQSVLDSEQSILAGSSRPSIFDEEKEAGESVLTPPVPASDSTENKALEQSEAEDDSGFSEDSEERDEMEVAESEEEEETAKEEEEEDRPRNL